MSTSRQYGLILLGATGYTGKRCAQHITKHLPTNLRWGVAGRSTSKLQNLVDELKGIHSDRAQPDILAINLQDEELIPLVKKCTVLLNCIGPYHLYSTPIVKACAENGTHYLDVTGETPWVKELIERYHETARSNHAILIPEIGIESAPSDLLAYLVASTLRKALNRSVSEATCAVYEVKGGGVSGGTLATALGLLDHYTFQEIRASSNPYVLSTQQQQQKQKQQSSQPQSSRSLLSRILGPFTHPDLGILTTSITAIPNEAIVYRSASLMPDLYGSDFRYKEYLKVSNQLFGVLIHFGLILATLAISLKPVRSLIRRFVYEPGQGPSSESSANAILELRAVATADSSHQYLNQEAKKATARIRYQGGGPYDFTGVLLAEGGMVLLQNPDLVNKLGGGILTPACLGDKYVERLRGANVQVDAGMLN